MDDQRRTVLQRHRGARGHHWLGHRHTVQLKPGDVFTVRGKPLPIIGALRETDTKDGVAAFVPLAVAQEIHDVRDKVSFIAVQVTDLEGIEIISLSAYLFGPILTDNAFTASLRQAPSFVLDEGTILEPI